MATDEADGAELVADDATEKTTQDEPSVESAVLQNQTSEKSQVFTEFTSKNKLLETHNDIDFILDIPVQLTV